MTVTRRHWLKSAGAVSVGAAASTVTAHASAAPSDPYAGPSMPTVFPDKAGFGHMDVTYLNAGTYHPFSRGARAALDAYNSHRSLDPAYADLQVDEARVLDKFARLINADKGEVAFVQSTTMGENMIVSGLGLAESQARIVTDSLHFFGSIPLYEELQKQGCDVVWVRDRDGRIDLDDMKKAITPGTKFVALSLVSTINGFQHDLKAVCELAHAQGALVYADIVHAAGCIPVDVKATGVDFAACASYKWLMGDFGLGFVYARKDVQHLIRRPLVGYYALGAFKSHLYPFDTPGDMPADYTFEDSAKGLFAVGTSSESLLAQLDYSLGYLLTNGPDRIQAHAKPLTDRLKAELPKLGYTLMTPLDCPTPMVACVYQNARALDARLTAGKVSISLSANRFRFSVSVFNDDADIARALSVLGRA
ncbi:aminotransferase class V-fold PLP-dependent enzyme [Asticcacaulis sp. 201]|uniref:aminotransferase class V-fold PLP-dependent enzyme n=1 Tax=Asticcacaulis sp. 201 TaxID=3028787 RepID=UPI002915D229|nr:aminotransferase class V-fold PLP-dependent enzyme [Asticcacaulis sp. 201]MDV6332951.1 aminotransferase class V-fold PLP-dependent enzyme [Asticcacaulis sp. 201]